MLLTIGIIILILWALGFLVHIGGGLIHILLAVGIIFLVVHLLTRHDNEHV